MTEDGLVDYWSSQMLWAIGVTPMAVLLLGVIRQIGVLQVTQPGGQPFVDAIVLRGVLQFVENHALKSFSARSALGAAPPVQSFS